MTMTEAAFRNLYFRLRANGRISPNWSLSCHSASSWVLHSVPRYKQSASTFSKSSLIIASNIDLSKYSVHYNTGYCVRLRLLPMLTWPLIVVDVFELGRYSTWNSVRVSVLAFLKALFVRTADIWSILSALVHLFRLCFMSENSLENKNGNF